jgi:predicted dehydrogenase
MVNVAIIGYGYWGPNLVRNFLSSDSSRVTMVADARQERLDLVTRSYPSIKTTQQPADVFKSSEVDAVVIATPVFSHFDLAQQALKAGKHVLIEKPMTSSVKEADDLIKLAKEKKKALMVDHTFLYTGSVKKMKELIEQDVIGKVNYFDSVRINLGLFQPDINVLWDLAPHDLSILRYLIQEEPYSVNATGVSHTNNGIENVAYMTVNYKSGIIAHFTCSWSSPVKIRMMLVGGDKKMIVFNDIEPSEKIKIYDTGYSVRTDLEKQRILVDYRVGDVHIPKVEMQEALQGVARDFISAIVNDTTPVSDYKMGREVVKLLEAAQHSIKNRGKEVIL